MKIFKSHKELDVYQMAFETSMEIYLLSKKFPKEELYSLTSQVRRSSRSVSANIAEGFRKRRYEKAFMENLITLSPSPLLLFSLPSSNNSLGQNCNSC
ncbi:MAG: four helix bundle protein [Bacteroidales bacterium]